VREEAIKKCLKETEPVVEELDIFDDFDDEL
jgi:hypothetical protein